MHYFTSACDQRDSVGAWAAAFTSWLVLVSCVFVEPLSDPSPDPAKTFTVPGLGGFPYYCTVHYDSNPGYKGAVYVVP